MSDKTWFVEEAPPSRPATGGSVTADNGQPVTQRLRVCLRSAATDPTNQNPSILLTICALFVSYAARFKIHPIFFGVRGFFQP